MNMYNTVKHTIHYMIVIQITGAMYKVEEPVVCAAGSVVFVAMTALPSFMPYFH